MTFFDVGETILLNKRSGETGWGQWLKGKQFKVTRDSDYGIDTHIMYGTHSIVHFGNLLGWMPATSEWFDKAGPTLKYKDADKII